MTECIASHFRRVGGRFAIEEQGYRCLINIDRASTHPSAIEDGSEHDAIPVMSKGSLFPVWHDKNPSIDRVNEVASNEPTTHLTTFSPV